MECEAVEVLFQGLVGLCLVSTFPCPIFGSFIHGPSSYFEARKVAERLQKWLSFVVSVLLFLGIGIAARAAFCTIPLKVLGGCSRSMFKRPFRPQRWLTPQALGEGNHEESSANQYYGFYQEVFYKLHSQKLLGDFDLLVEIGFGWGMLEASRTQTRLVQLWCI